MADENLSVADIAAVTRPYGGYGYGMPYGGYGMGGFGFEWIFIFALFAMMGGGFGGFGGWGGFGNAGLGALDGGVLGYAIGNNATKGDLSDGLNSVQTMNKLDNITTQMTNGLYGVQSQISNGVHDISNQLCCGFNSTNTNLLKGFSDQNVLSLQNTNALQTQLANNRFADQQCCCETQKQIAAQTAENFKNTCDIVNAIQQDGEKTREFLVTNKIADLEEKLAERARELQTAQIEASQQAQTNALINALRPTPIPSYVTCSPYQSAYVASNGFGCGCNNNFIV